MMKNHALRYGFQFRENSDHISANIFAVGMDFVTSDYSNEGRKRHDPFNNHIFQYTLSGRAALRMGGTTYKLTPGKAFLLQLRGGDYTYYLPDDSDKYECIFITLYGRDVTRCWSYVTEELGPVAAFKEDSSLIQTLLKIYREAEQKRIADLYHSSSLAYSFMMELYRACKPYTQIFQEDWPLTIKQAAALMKQNYHAIHSLEDVASAVGLTKFHLTRRFHIVTGQTPMQYLSKIRIEKAVELLRTTDKTIEEIAEEIGYSSGNYFSKAFRKLTGSPPTAFRKSKDGLTVDHLTIN